MDVTTTPTRTETPLTAGTLYMAQSGTEFADRLDAAGAVSKKINELESAVHDQVSQFVAMTFVQPILDQMQEDPFRSELFHGGSGERMFTKHLNAELAQRVTNADGFGVVHAIHQKFIQQVRPHIEATAERELKFDPGRGNYGKVVDTRG